MRTIAGRLACGEPPRLRRCAIFQFPVKWSANIRSPACAYTMHGSFKPWATRSSWQCRN